MTATSKTANEDFYSIGLPVDYSKLNPGFRLIKQINLTPLSTESARVYTGTIPIN